MLKLEPPIAFKLARGNPERSGLHVYHDVDLNVPFFKRKYAGSNVLDVCEYAKWWCDPRPATRSDLERLEEGVVWSLGHDAWRVIRRIVERGVVLVNTDDAGVADQVWEFFVNGLRLGTLFYHVRLSRPVFIPGFLAARLLEHEGLLETIDWCGGEKVDTGKLSIVECHGVYRGVAVPLSTASVSILVEEEPPPRDAYEVLVNAERVTLEDVYRANLEYVETLVEKTRRAVEWLERRLGRRGVLGFSGGKDSLLALHLLVEAESNVIAFYSHIEHGDPKGIDEYVEKTAERLGVELVMHYNDWGRVERMLRAFGMPVRGYRWCTQVFKISPLMNFLKMLGRESVVSYTGARSYETLKRGLKPATYVDVEHHVLVHMVPYKWPRFLEMLALKYRYRAELPRDYEVGFERISCVTCPNKTLFELRLSERMYPDDFNPWLPYMLELADSMAPWCRECILEYHLWRFMMQPGEARSIAEVGGFNIRLRMPGPRRRPRRLDTSGIERLRRNLAVVAPGSRVEDGVVVSGECRINIEDERGVWLEKGGFEKCSKLLKLAYASLYCVECMLCIPRCPYDAVRVPLEIDPERCKSSECSVCYSNCPLAWGAVDIALANLYLGYRGALARLQRMREERGRVYVERARRAEEEVYKTKVTGGALGGGASSEAGERGGQEA